MFPPISVHRRLPRGLTRGAGEMQRRSPRHVAGSSSQHSEGGSSGGGTPHAEVPVADETDQEEEL